MKEFIKLLYKKHNDWESSLKGQYYFLNFVVENKNYITETVMPVFYKEISEEKLKEINEFYYKKNLQDKIEFIKATYLSNSMDFNNNKDYLEFKQRLENFNYVEEENKNIEEYLILIIDLYQNSAKTSSEETLITFSKNCKDIINLEHGWNYYFNLRKGDFFEIDRDGIIDVYNSNGFDILRDKTFSKFSLIDATEFYTFPPRVYDSRINKTFFLSNKYTELLNYLETIKPFFSKIQLQIIPEHYKNGKIDKTLIKEEIEVGKYLELNSIFTPNVTQLYDDYLKDKLRVTINPNGIMFEELVTDFEINEEGVIYTRIVHAQYSKNLDKIVINHLDCEFARYENLDVYIEAMKISQDILNGKTKGLGKPIKIFKIDDAQIPFILDNGRYIILDVLELFFKNKDLIKEYFSLVQNNPV